MLNKGLNFYGLSLYHNFTCLQVAISNIRKQTLLPLNRKIRRPDSDEMDETDSVYHSKRNTVAVSSENKKKEEHEANAEKNSEVFTKPMKPAKKKTDKRVEREEPEKLTKRTDSVQSVKETIARFEELEKLNQEAKATSTPIKPSPRSAIPSHKGGTKTAEKLLKNGKDVIQNGTEQKNDGERTIEENHVTDKEKGNENDQEESGGTVEVTLPSAAQENVDVVYLEPPTRTSGADRTESTVEAPKVPAIPVRHTRSRSRSAEVVLTNEPSPAISPVPYPPGERRVVDESLDESTVYFEKRKNSDEENNKNVPNIGNDAPVPSKKRKPKKGSLLSSTIFDETLDGKKKSPELGLHDKTVERRITRNTSKADSAMWVISDPAVAADNSPQPKTKRTKARKPNVVPQMVDPESAGGGVCEENPSNMEKTEKNLSEVETGENLEVGNYEKITTIPKPKRTKARKGKRAVSRSIMSNTSHSSVDTSLLVVNDGYTTDNKTPKNANNGTFVVTRTSGKRSEPMAEMFGSGPETVIRVKKPRKNPSASLEDVDPVSRGSFEKSMETIEFHVPRPVASKRTKVVANPKQFDADGNLITRAAGTRTKTLTGELLR